VYRRRGEDYEGVKECTSGEEETTRSEIVYRRRGGDYEGVKECTSGGEEETMRE
jgi:hypothetical protein